MTAVICGTPVPATIRHTNAQVGWWLQDALFFHGPGHTSMQRDSAAPPIQAATVDRVVRTAPIGPATLITTTWDPSMPPAGELRLVERVRPLAALTATVDLGDAIGAIADVRTGPGIEVGWTWAGNAGHRGDVVMAWLNAAGRNLRFYGPGDADRIVIPAWPAALDDIRPAPATLQPIQVTAFDLDGTTSYAAALGGGYLTGQFHGHLRGPEYPGAYWRSTRLPRFE